MKSEKGTVPCSQLAFMLLAFMQGSIYLTTFTFPLAPRDVWLAVIAAGLAYIPFALINIRLAEKFPNESIIKINDRVFGRVLGKIISIFYCLFLLVACSVNLRFPSSFLANVFMTDTPYIVFALLLLLLCMWAAKSGVTAIGRVAVVLAPLIVLSIAIYFLLLLNRMELSRFLPIMRVEPAGFFKSFAALLTIYAGENFVFLMITPYIKDKTKLRKSYLLGTLFGFLAMLVLTVLVIAVLGGIAAISNAPLVQTVRLVELMGINARIEFIFMCFLSIVAFYKCSILFFALLTALEGLFGLKEKNVLIVPVAISVFALIMVTTESSAAQAEASVSSIPILLFALLFLLPAATAITAAARRLGKRAGGDGS